MLDSKNEIPNRENRLYDQTNMTKQPHSCNFLFVSISQATEWMGLSSSSFRALLLLDTPHQAHIQRGCAGMPEGRRRNCQGGTDVLGMEDGLRPLRRRLAGWWERALSHRPPTEALQSHRGSGALCRLPWKEAEAIWCLLLQGIQLSGERTHTHTQTHTIDTVFTLLK